MVERRRSPSAAELELWRLVTRDAQPLVSPRRPAAAKPAAPPVPDKAADRTADKTALAPPVSAVGGRLPGPAERLAQLLGTLPVKEKAAVRLHLAPSPLGAKAGIDKRTEEKVRRGRLPIDGRIDLHGLTQAEAHDRLLSFVRSSHAQGRRLLLVITGKGGVPRGEGVLRAAVPRWLNEAAFRALVLAVHQAQPQHGGGGAFYVYLKRRRE
ncbi:Smr/MutS family protein [Oleisolibacter albus]|uniref:Smr/MutS family protein n=1 Tax=Oleisolibacter albus TaxID=2171757 RepID=UPI0013900780|nr:Smr/MutS family protein [Oleisolibacter albus]